MEQLAVCETRFTIPNRLEELEGVIERGLNTFMDVGSALLEIRDSRLYKHEYATFEDYCQDRWNISRPQAYRLIDAASVAMNLSPIGDILPANEAQVRPLVQLSPDKQREVWTAAIDTAPDTGITAAHVKQTVERITRPENIHVSDDSYEWYTPMEYVEAAQQVMGWIDLDPASCTEANQVVCAGKYFDQGDDGLKQEWHGKVFLNPPYNMPNVELFTGKAHELYESGEVEQVIILVNNSTDAAWFHVLLQRYPVCFTRGRVKYYGPHAAQARQGQAFFYLGNNVEMFTKVFSRFGVVLQRHDYS